MYNLDNIIGDMKDVAIQAALFLIDAQSKSKQLKSDKDFLTDTDLESERIIIEALKSRYPEVPSFAEEGGGPEIKEGYVWVIDPIDGTINFFRQDENWGISIALIKDGQSIAGVICLPAKRLLYSALLGKPAQLFDFEKQINLAEPRVNQERIMKSAQFWIGWGKEENRGEDHKHVHRIIADLDSKTLYPQIRNSAAVDTMAVASGKIEGYILLKPEPFDVAAAGLIIQQAGGVVTDVDGHKWEPFSKSFVASNGVLHEDLLRVVQE